MVPAPVPSGPVPRRIDAVLFDLFGTLIPTGSQVQRVENLGAMARELGVDPPAFARRWLDTFDPRVRGRYGSLEATVERLARELGATPSERSIERAANLRRTLARSLLDAGAASLPALDALRTAGAHLALVSDTSDDTVQVWSSTALAARFEVTVFSCVERNRKPDRRMFATAVERLGVTPSVCAYVGDGGSHELTGAQAAGIPAFRYVFPGEEGSAYRVDAEPDWRGPQLRDLRDLLRSGTFPKATSE